MAITRRQGNTAASSGSVTTQAVTLPSGVLQGNLLVCAVAIGNNATTITAPDASWTQSVLNQPAGSNATIEAGIWYLVVDAAHAGQTSWTWTGSVAHSMFLCISEWSATNGWPSNPLDVSASGDTIATPVAATSIASGTTATTTQAEELWIASLAYKSTAQTESSITSGWTRDMEASATGLNTMTMLYQIASSPGAASCSYTIGTAQYWAGCVATFKDAPVSAPTHVLMCDGTGGVFR